MSNISNKEIYNAEVVKATEIYAAQMKQLQRAYEEDNSVSWRRHPLSSLTPIFLSHLTTNLTCNNSNVELLRPRIIDLGCGAGEKTDRLRSFSLDIIGVDNLRVPLSMAKRLTDVQVIDSSMELVMGDIRQLPFLDETFDGAHDYLSFLHVVRKDWPLYIDSVYRVLKKGAPLVLVTFSGNDPDFYGYPIDRMGNREIIFSDQYYQGDKSKVAHLVDSYFFFPKKGELRSAFENHFEILDMVEIFHPLHHESQDHKFRKLWHILMRKY